MVLKPLSCLKSFHSKLLLALLIGVSSFQRSEPSAVLNAAVCQVEDAVALMGIEDYESAIPLLKEALLVFEKAKDGESYLAACRKLDDCFFETDYLKGIAFFEAATKKAEHFENSKLQKAYFFSYLGSYYYYDDPARAIANYKESLSYAEMIKDTSLMSRCYVNIGRLYWDSGNHEGGLDLLMKALPFFQNLKDSSNLATVLYYIGDIYRSKADLRSFSCFRQSLAINPNDPQTWIQFSKAYQDFGKIDSAFVVLAQALPLLGDDAAGKADGYYQYARLYREKHNFPKAIACINQALTYGEAGYGIEHIEYARISNLAGKIYLESNNPDKALAWFHKNLLAQSAGANEVMDASENPALDQLSPGSYWVLGSIEGKGAAYFQKYKQTRDPKTLEYALAAFELAIAYGENMRLSYGHESSKAELYEYLDPAVSGGIKTAMELASLTGDASWSEKAFSFAERVKAAVMAEALYDKSIRHLGGVPDTLLEQERRLQESIAELEIGLHSEPDSATAYQDALLDAKLQLTQLKDKLERDFPRYYELKYAFRKNAPLPQIQDKLGEGDLLVEYYRGDSTLYTFALSKKQLKAYATPITGVFDSTLNQFRRSLSDWDYVKYAEADAARDYLTSAPKLYEWLLARPLSDFKASHLTIVPVGTLGLIPFDALLTAPYSGSWRDRDVPYLLKQCPVSYAWSAGATIYGNRQTSGVSYHFGGFGTQYDDDPKPVAMRGDLGALPNADDEVRGISALLKGKSWLNGEATKAHFLDYAPLCGILHIATHGILDEEDPMQSHLVFNKTADGAENRVFASELYNMDLHAQLAVLSACNTGSGKLAAGEGNMSIARAFAYAGCPTLVSNLWSADDQASAKLMQLFYQNLKSGAKVDDALQAAKLSYLDSENASVSLPFYWANFIVAGERDALSLPSHRGWLSFGASLIGAGFLYFLYRRFYKQATV